MIYYTGDIHGMPWNIISFCKKVKTTKDDTIVILGDVGANYYGDSRDIECKRQLSKVNPTVLCIHGNHEMRPSSIPTYKTKEWNGGTVWFEETYPNLLFAKDGEIFDIEGIRHLVIGGAYSVDKYYRLARGYGWWADEQPSDEIKAYVEQQITNKDFDVILSHTCPLKYEPIEMFLTMIDQSTVDKSTEIWLDSIEERVKYKAWFCGHWHTNKRIDKMHFLYGDFELSSILKEQEIIDEKD